MCAFHCNNSFLIPRLQTRTTLDLPCWCDNSFLIPRLQTLPTLDLPDSRGATDRTPGRRLSQWRGPYPRPRRCSRSADASGPPTRRFVMAATYVLAFPSFRVVWGQLLLFVAGDLILPTPMSHSPPPTQKSKRFRWTFPLISSVSRHTFARTMTDPANENGEWCGDWNTDAQSAIDIVSPGLGRRAVGQPGLGSQRTGTAAAHHAVGEKLGVAVGRRSK